MTDEFIDHIADLVTVAIYPVKNDALSRLGYPAVSAEV